MLLLRSGQLTSHSTPNCSSSSAVGQRGVVAAGLIVSPLIVVFHIQNWWDRDDWICNKESWCLTHSQPPPLHCVPSHIMPPPTIFSLGGNRLTLGRFLSLCSLGFSGTLGRWAGGGGSRCVERSRGGGERRRREEGGEETGRGGGQRRRRGGGQGREREEEE